MEAEARGPAAKHLVQERDAAAWSQALFCEVLTEKTNNFSFFKICQQQNKNISLALGGDLSISGNTPRDQGFRPLVICF